MRKTADRKWMHRAVGMMASLLAAFSIGPVPDCAAEEYEDVTLEAFDDGSEGEVTEELAGEEVQEADAASGRMGTYPAPENWEKVDSLSKEDSVVYKRSGYGGEDETSTITCDYIDTNYRVVEYEQLRDMLTNNLVYSNVNAQISSSAVYTKAKDYLYILTVDDSSKDYRDIYYYVVGDMRCFCVTVKEYRSEAEEMKASDTSTPQEAGQKTAEEFTWDAT